MFKPSRRAAVIAASFALGLSCVSLPYANAGLLDGGGSSGEGIGLPVGGDLLGGDLLGGILGENGLLGGDLLGGVLGGDLLGGVLGGGALGGQGLGGGLPLVGDVLGGDLLGGGLPLVGGVLGEDGVLGGELLGGTLQVVTDTTLGCDAAIPQVLWALLGDVTEAVCAPFSEGVLGLLGSL